MVCPAGTTTAAGTVSIDGSPLASATVKPPDGAASLSSTVATTLSPLENVVPERVSRDSRFALIVVLAVTEAEPADAVTVTFAEGPE